MAGILYEDTDSVHAFVCPVQWTSQSDLFGRQTPIAPKRFRLFIWLACSRRQPRHGSV